jgi:Heme exporter protein D (CcmD)
MSNLAYIIAAYAITLAALALYGVHLWRRLRSAERELATLTASEGAYDGRQ